MKYKLGKIFKKIEMLLLRIVTYDFIILVLGSQSVKKKKKM